MVFQEIDDRGIGRRERVAKWQGGRGTAERIHFSGDSFLWRFVSLAIHFSGDSFLWGFISLGIHCPGRANGDTELEFHRVSVQTE